MYYFNSKKVYDSCSETLFIGKKIVYLTTCHSTNDIAAELLLNGTLKEGDVVISDEQTAGRGMRGSHWVSKAGENLTFSVVLRPDFLPVARQFALSQVVALGVVSGIRRHAAEALIKWPNDVYLAGKKIVGMLIENTVQGKLLLSSVAGIGLNTNQLDFFGIHATSLRAYTGREIDKGQLLRDVLIGIEEYYLRLKEGDGERIQQEYLENLLGYGEERSFVAEGIRFSGSVAGVQPTGQIEIRIPEGGTRIFDLKELEWCFD